MYFHEGLKNLYIQKLISYDFILKISNIEAFCLFVYGGIVVKMDNSHLFEEVFNYFFHA
jgi:hypothetical protein